ncbi:DUF4129 domain-containing protein [Halorhabdus sp. CUG00001]|uniref:DUF4129 domain-containing protein n=1 Tax=Halorhabdus sp. CUG00001 TaxID=2600297 RepID=UPI00131E4493|nr:DUF4129 domain-containing protein [Halorhabdus sp. CUG00001]
MDRRRGLVIVVTVFGLIALTLAAATLTDPTVNTGGGGKFGFSGNGTGGLFSGADNQSSVDVVVPPGVLPVFQVLAVALTLLAVVVAFRTFSWSDLARIAMLAVIAVLFGWLLVMLLELLAGSFGGRGGILPGGAAGGFGPLVSAPERTLSIANLPLAVWLVLVVVVVAAVGTIVRLSGDASVSEAVTDQPSDRDSDQLEAMGDAAGRAASRLAAGTETTNAVYQAWQEMTAALEVSNPAATTPAEFARAAIDAGMHPEHVEDLTRLFEDVRYGGEPPSDEREQRARTALREIEATYADLDTETTGGDDP